MKIVSNRLKIEFIKKDGDEKFTEQRSKLTFNELHKSYKIYDGYNFTKMNFLRINVFT